MNQLKAYIKKQAVDLMSYDKRISNLLVVTTVIFLINEVREIYLSNPSYFFESLFRYTNIFYFASLGLVILFFYKHSAILFLILLVFYLDFFFLLKRYFQSLVFAYSDGDHFLFVYSVVFTILLALLVSIFFVPYRYLKIISSFILFFYSYGLISAQLTTSKSVIPKMIEPSFRVDSIKRDLYIFLFDEYPSIESFRRNFPANSLYHADATLKSSGFNSFTGIFSNYPNTEKSVTSFLTGTLHDSVTINNVIEALDNNTLSKGRNFSFHAFSIFDEANRKNSLVTTQFFRGINSTMSRYLAPYVISRFSTRGVGNFTNYADYHSALIRKLSETSILKKRKVFFGHFYTPHYYPRVISQDIKDRLNDANKWMKSAIEIVANNDSTASILIISDHGLRLNRMPKTDYNKNILYYKNLSIDTLKLQKEGLYKLIEAINFY